LNSGRTKIWRESRDGTPTKIRLFMTSAIASHCFAAYIAVIAYIGGMKLARLDRVSFDAIILNSTQLNSIY